VAVYMNQEELKKTYMYKKFFGIHPKLAAFFLWLGPRSIISSLTGSLILFPVGIFLGAFGYYLLCLKFLFLSFCLYVYAKFYRSFLSFDAIKAGKNFLEIPYEYLIVFALLILTGFLANYFPWITLEHAFLTHIDEEFKINTLLGTLGDFFGGVLNPILSFFTIFILVLQHKENSKREEARDIRESDREIREKILEKETKEFQLELSRREEKRDQREDERDKRQESHYKNTIQLSNVDLFFNRIKLLDQKIENLHFNQLKGLDALIRFSDVAERVIRKGNFNENVPGLDSSTYECLAILKSLNNLFEEAIKSNYLLISNQTEVGFLSNPTSLYKYEFLSSHYNEGLIIQLNKIIKYVAAGKADHPYDLSRNANYIYSMYSYISNEKKDFPAPVDFIELAKIYSKAEKIKNNQEGIS
jgi:hypothetical protein